MGRLRETEQGSGAAMTRAGIVQVRRFLELIRFSHTIFALPFALLSAVLAWRTVEFRWRDLVGILLCMVSARSASMAFNRVADRHIDAQNPRTAARHLPAGLLDLRVVVMFIVACGVGFVASTLLFLPNRLPLILSLPVLAFLCGYSYAKRFTALAHYWLGAALMLSPIAAWIAVTGGVAWPPVLLGLAVFFWVGGFDIIYACQDVDFDRVTPLVERPRPLRRGPRPANRRGQPSAHRGLSLGIVVERPARSPVSGQRDRRRSAVGL